MGEKRKLHFKPRKCLECGREFIPRSGTQRYCDGPHTTYCKICGKEIQYTCSPNVKPNYCSQECINKGHEQTVMKRYGVKNVSELQSVRNKISEKNKSEETVKKREQTCLERYGATNPSKSDVIKEKLSSIMKSEEFLKKREQTCIQRYGTSSPMQNDAVKEKLRRSNQKKHGVDWVCQSEDWKEKTIETNMQKYGVPYYCMTSECKSQQGLVISHRNQHVKDMFESAGFRIELEYTLENRSYDMLLLGTNILVEIDPSYTHTVIGNHWGKRIDYNYHIEKSKLAKKYGYRCIHIFDWDDIGKLIHILKPKEKIYARNCDVEVINAQDANQFLIKYHIQGTVSRQKILLGLKHENELVQLMTFGKSRYTSKYEWELLRLCSGEFTVVGGAQKLFYHFVHTYNPNSVVSYCDLSKFSGDVYKKLGMSLDHYSAPAKVWSRYSNKITDNLLRQRGYDQLFGTNYGKGTSNEQLMIQNGWLPVYDCGQAVYTWRKGA